MKGKKGMIFVNVIVIVIFMSLSRQLYSQAFEAGMGLGYASYNGELNGGDIETYIDFLEPVVSAWVGIHLVPRIHLQLEGYVGKLYGSDQLSSDKGRRARNLRFESPIYGLNLKGEFNFLKFIPGTRKNITPYLIVSAGGMYFDPYMDFQTQRVKLQPIGTEGQGIKGYEEPYSLYTFTAGFGGGLKVMLTESVAISGEAVYVYAYTDYLDDVSSSKNVPYEIILAQKGVFAADISNQRDDYEGIPPNEYSGLDQRGVPGTKDGYALLRVKMTYFFAFFEIGRMHVKCYEF